jgi:flagellar biosynthetic protein FliR
LSFTIDFAWLEAFLLTMMRMIGFVIIAPPFSYGSFPLRIKAIFATALALAISPKTTPGHELLTTSGFISHMLTEALTGFTIGFVIFAIFISVQSAGAMIDMFSSLQMASLYDHNLKSNASPFGRLFEMSALLLLFATGGYQLLILGLSKTFDAIPLGEGIPPLDSVQAVIKATSFMIVAMAQIAGPIVLILVLTDVALGLVTRVAPSLNAFALGMPLKVLITLSVVALSFTSMPEIVKQLTGKSLSVISGGG